MLCVCTFAFLTLLVQTLDDDHEWSPSAILMPIIIMYPVLLFLHPLVVFELQRFQRLVNTYTDNNNRFVSTKSKHCGMQWIRLFLIRVLQPVNCRLMTKLPTLMPGLHV